jgi:hypothetical protein
MQTSKFNRKTVLIYIHRGLFNVLGLWDLWLAGTYVFTSYSQPWGFYHLRNGGMLDIGSVCGIGLGVIRHPWVVFLCARGWAAHIGCLYLPRTDEWLTLFILSSFGITTFCRDKCRDKCRDLGSDVIFRKIRLLLCHFPWDKISRWGRGNFKKIPGTEFYGKKRTYLRMSERGGGEKNFLYLGAGLWLGRMRLIFICHARVFYDYG